MQSIMLGLRRGNAHLAFSSPKRMSLMCHKYSCPDDVAFVLCSFIRGAAGGPVQTYPVELDELCDKLGLVQMSAPPFSGLYTQAYVFRTRTEYGAAAGCSLCVLTGKANTTPPLLPLPPPEED